LARKAKPPTRTQPPASAPVFSGSKWASLDEAFDLAASALGSSYLAEEDLTRRFRDGRLPTAVLHWGDDADTIKALEPASWKTWQVVETEVDGVLMIQVWGLPGEIARSVPHFFVAREPLEQLYSPGLAIEPVSAPPADAPGAPTRRKPGPQTKKVGSCTSPPSCIAL
jgi:hypothetical protein